MARITSRTPSRVSAAPARSGSISIVPSLPKPSTAQKSITSSPPFSKSILFPTGDTALKAITATGAQAVVAAQQQQAAQAAAIAAQNAANVAAAAGGGGVAAPDSSPASGGYEPPPSSIPQSEPPPSSQVPSSQVDSQGNGPDSAAQAAMVAPTPAEMMLSPRERLGMFLRSPAGKIAALLVLGGLGYAAYVFLVKRKKRTNPRRRRRKKRGHTHPHAKGGRAGREVWR
jgi:hypothetical protein